MPPLLRAVTRLSARIQGGNNVAILLAPLVPAFIANEVGLQLAFGVVPIAVLAATALAVVVRLLGTSPAP